MTRRAILLAALCALALAAHADEEPARRVLLRHRFAPGETLLYRARVEGKGTIAPMGESQSVSIRGDFTLDQKVLAVDEAGAGRIATQVEKGALVLRTPTVSQRLPISLPRLVQTLAPEGRLLKSEGWGPETGGSAQAHINLRHVIERLHILSFPDHPLAVGDSWLAAPPAPAEAPPQPPSGEGEGAPAAAPPAPQPVKPEPVRRCTLLAFERLGGRECARIRATAESPIHEVLPPDPLGDIVELEGRERLQTMTWFAIDAGRVVRQAATAHTTLQTRTIPAAGGTPMAGHMDITATITLELGQPAGAQSKP